MINPKWYFAFNVILLFLASFLLTRRILTYFKTGEIDYIRISINAIFVVYLIFRIYQTKQNS